MPEGEPDQDMQGGSDDEDGEQQEAGEEEDEDDDVEDAGARDDASVASEELLAEEGAEGGGGGAGQRDSDDSDDAWVRAAASQRCSLCAARSVKGTAAVLEPGQTPVKTYSPVKVCREATPNRGGAAAAAVSPPETFLLRVASHASARSDPCGLHVVCAPARLLVPARGAHADELKGVCHSCRCSSPSPRPGLSGERRPRRPGAGRGLEGTPPARTPRAAHGSASAPVTTERGPPWQSSARGWRRALGRPGARCAGRHPPANFKISRVKVEMEHRRVAKKDTHGTSRRPGHATSILCALSPWSVQSRPGHALEELRRPQHSRSTPGGALTAAAAPVGRP